jgi:Mn-containing catalase
MQALLSRPTPLQVGGTLPVRPLFEVALENAVEGCVRETYGAAQARWQVERAAWPALRAAMEAIAEEELSHAELAFEVAAWLDARLTPQEQARLAMARAQEIAHLREALSVEAAAAVRDAVGLPSAAQALALHARLQADLWA